MCPMTPVFPNDCDGDGIPDSIEIATGTQFDNPDSDGDTICDGANSVGELCEGGEDLNNDGQVDPGEFDPRLTDTDLDGVPDNMEPQRIVCRDEIYATISAEDATIAQSVMALPEGYELTTHTSARAVAFSNPTAKVYGYMVLQDTTDSVGAAHVQNQALIGAANKRTNDISSRFTSWLEVASGNVAANNALRTKGSFSYGAGEPNTTPSLKDPAVLRDEIISAIAPESVTTGETSVACSRVVNFHVSELRSGVGGDTLVSVGLLACEDDINVDVQNFFDDLLTTTIYAPSVPVVYVPENKHCDLLSASSQGGVVDFLWVIDNSGSMSDEQENITATTQLFLDRLQSSNTDWRLAVTTTDAYCLDDDDPLYADCKTRLNADPIREQCTGLRGAGFLSRGQQNVESNFQAYVAQNAGCTNPPSPGDVGKNVCGFGLESGLRSAQTVIQRLKSTDRGATCPMGSEYEIRNDAQVVVVFVTDEEDQEFKSSGTTGTILPANDQVRVDRTAQYITTFNDIFNVRIYAIAGDEGADAGGVCTALEGGGIVGAEYGLGYKEVAEGTSGAVGSVCNSDLAVTVDTIITDTIGQVSNYPLEKLPITSSIYVATADNGIIRRGDDGTGSAYWSYNADNNSITFFNLSLEENEDIVIAYRSWTVQGG